MRKKYLLAASAIVLVAASSVFSFKVCAENKDGVAARINDEVISIEEVRKGYDENPQIAAQTTFENFYDKAVDIFINGKLLYQAATKAKIQDTPEYKEQIKLAQEDLARKIFLEKKVAEKASNAALKDLYDNYYIKSFKSEKEIRAKHILTNSEANAQEAIKKLNEGAKFEDVAKEYTRDAAVDLGYFTHDAMVPEFSEAAFALKKGEYTKKPVKTQFGYHVILLEDSRDSAPVPMNEMMPQLKNALTQKIIAETFDELYDASVIKKYSLDGRELILSKPID